MIFRSPYPDIAIPDQAFTPFVLARAAELGDKPALIDAPSGRTITYAGLLDGVRRVGAALVGRHIAKGDVVAMYAPNLPEYAVAFLGIAGIGAVVTTVNPLNTAEELARQLQDSGARLLITAPPMLDRARQAAAQASTVEEIIVLGEAEGATPFTALLAAQGQPPAVSIDPAEDLLVLPYSSGTTGLPKGVMLTHRNVVANIAQFLTIDGDHADDVAIGILPFYHIYGMVVVMGTMLRAGGTIVTLPRFEIEAFLTAMQKYRVTVANLVPPVILALAKHPAVDRYDLSSLKGIGSGAAPLGPEVAQACAERVGCAVRQGYGLTESSPVTHFTPPGPGRNRPGSVGPPVPNTEVQIVDLSGEPLGAGEEGEIWVRGPQVMKGYLHQPEATERTLTRDGWLRTGDIGRVDDDAYLFIVDRAKELIKYKGYQVPPAELEAVLLSHPGIADAAVIGKPDETAGEVPKAFVVRRAPLTAEEVMDFVAARVAPYKKLRAVEFRDAIPKSASGKILRRVLRDEERGAVSG
jgi:acyl-CoA synthetase (AMP-forming)/AMP-acid ligase II